MALFDSWLGGGGRGGNRTRRMERCEHSALPLGYTAVVAFEIGSGCRQTLFHFHLQERSPDSLAVT